MSFENNQEGAVPVIAQDASGKYQKLGLAKRHEGKIELLLDMDMIERVTKTFPDTQVGLEATVDGDI